MFAVQWLCDAIVIIISVQTNVVVSLHAWGKKLLNSLFVSLIFLRFHTSYAKWERNVFGISMIMSPLTLSIMTLCFDDCLIVVDIGIVALENLPKQHKCDSTKYIFHKQECFLGAFSASENVELPLSLPSHMHTSKLLLNNEPTCIQTISSNKCRHIQHISTSLYSCENSTIPR